MVPKRVALDFLRQKAAFQWSQTAQCVFGFLVGGSLQRYFPLTSAALACNIYYMVTHNNNNKSPAK